ncbi:hypothetical protein CONCODRAFT_72550 [Conidiobolus coronatus NRRL 28638]|uniref:Arrestin C-terminal-like domain-containing protein n=1 Tax=Conidiobolus coronatus (strain ATCC 28846 / CBS 209.66 / NRRL 28638) TaxID=796925 RepID=A0A137NZM1_CONC2|nr:hypothetical protein CONCODRAFT_72550 [Conidiobolus coronatus NRRL 28638]|eukprot:KXN68029.1 hypothetical protein CONCODRAFT_72550 [Conidiobolus coronatus NRRL 28638]
MSRIHKLDTSKVLRKSKPCEDLKALFIQNISSPQQLAVMHHPFNMNGAGSNDMVQVFEPFYEGQNPISPLLSPQSFQPVRRVQSKAKLKAKKNQVQNTPPKVKIGKKIVGSIEINRPFFQSNQLLILKLNLRPKSEPLQLKKIDIFLIGIEETSSKLNFNQKFFLNIKANLPDLELIKNNLFKEPVEIVSEFELGSDMPSSLVTMWASIRYLVVGEITYLTLNNKEEKFFISRELKILEQISRNNLKTMLKTCIIGEKNQPTSIFPILLPDSMSLFKCFIKIHKKLWLAGTPILVGLVGFNQSDKKIECIRLKLVRYLKVFSSSGFRSQTKSITNIISDSKYRNQYLLSGIQKGEEFDLVLSVDAPMSARSISNASTLEVKYTVRVEVAIKFGQTITIELPIIIAHPGSVTGWGTLLIR